MIFSNEFKLQTAQLWAERRNWKNKVAQRNKKRSEKKVESKEEIRSKPSFNQYKLISYSFKCCKMAKFLYKRKRYQNRQINLRLKFGFWWLFNCKDFFFALFLLFIIFDLEHPELRTRLSSLRWDCWVSESLPVLDLCAAVASVKICHVACEKQARGNKVREFDGELFCHVIAGQE